jgi:hypothetical protein
MPSIPLVSLPLPSSSTTSKAEHLAAIQQIEREEQKIREKIREKQRDRDLLQTILDSLQKKENGTTGPKR